eukprot:481166-Prorocentrum_minimum.AAC.1
MSDLNLTEDSTDIPNPDPHLNLHQIQTQLQFAPPVQSHPRPSTFPTDPHPGRSVATAAAVALSHWLFSRERIRIVERPDGPDTGPRKDPLPPNKDPLPPEKEPPSAASDGSRLGEKGEGGDKGAGESTADAGLSFQ